MGRRRDTDPPSLRKLGQVLKKQHHLLSFPASQPLCGSVVVFETPSLEHIHHGAFTKELARQGVARLVHPAIIRHRL